MFPIKTRSLLGRRGKRAGEHEGYHGEMQFLGSRIRSAL